MKTVYGFVVPELVCAPMPVTPMPSRHSGYEQHAGGDAEEHSAELHGCRQLSKDGVCAPSCGLALSQAQSVSVIDITFGVCDELAALTQWPGGCGSWASWSPPGGSNEDPTYVILNTAVGFATQRDIAPNCPEPPIAAPQQVETLGRVCEDVQDLLVAADNGSPPHG